MAQTLDRYSGRVNFTMMRARRPSACKPDDRRSVTVDADPRRSTKALAMHIGIFGVDLRSLAALSRRRWILIVTLVLFGLLWRPVLRPAGQAAIVISDIYSEQVVGVNLARLVTPEPRVLETDGRFADVPMRVTYWSPGWGDRHPAIMVVPGAAPRGNDEPLLRSFGVTLARAGYLVMIPEFPFLKQGRFEPSATKQLDAAFARARELPATGDRNVGAFGVSVGGGMLLVAAGREPALGKAAFIAILGGYYDIDTYLASVAGREQLSDGRLE